MLSAPLVVDVDARSRSRSFFVPITPALLQEPKKKAAPTSKTAADKKTESSEVEEKAEEKMGGSSKLAKIELGSVLPEITLL